MPTPVALTRRAALPPNARPRTYRASARFEVVRRLGASATSEVVLAVSRGPLGFERHVVLKRLIDQPGGDAGALGDARLAREALAYSRLVHPSIVRIYDFVEDGGRLTLVLEHVDGLSLARVLSGLRARGEEIDERAIWYVGYRVFQALSAAHSARDPGTQEPAPVIHRDVSPGNVLVPWDGYVKLTDFGVARIVGTASDTRPGVLKGTVGYLAPEQVRGELTTVRTDVYAGCLVLRELLLGAPVFPHERELDTLRAMATPALTPLVVLRPGLPTRLTSAIDRGLARDPEARSIAAHELTALLRSAIGDIDAARERLADAIAPLRRREAARAGRIAHATPPRGDPSAASLFEESGPSLDETTAPQPGHPEPFDELEHVGEREQVARVRRPTDSQERITTRPPAAPAERRGPQTPAILHAIRPPPATSMVVPRARPVTIGESTTASTQIPVSAPSQTPRMATAPPPSLRREAFTSRASLGFVFDAPKELTSTPPSWALNDHAPRPPPSRRSGLLIGAAAAAVGMGVVIGGVLGWRERAMVLSASEERQTSATATPATAVPMSASATATAVPMSATTTATAVPMPASATATAMPTTASATSATTLSPAAASAVAPTSAPTSTSALPPRSGRLVTARSEKGHRVFVDGRVVGSGGAPLVVRCGKHEVRVGSRGRRRTVEVPCGGDLTVTR